MNQQNNLSLKEIVAKVAENADSRVDNKGKFLMRR